MNAYLNDFKYTNAFTEDLWDALGKASGKPVGDVMTTWTKQMGYPVIKVSWLLPMAFLFSGRVFLFFSIIFLDKMYYPNFQLKYQL